MGNPIRVLHVVTHMNRGGLETMIMNYYRHMDREQVQFDFLVHREARAAYDDEIEQLGGVIFRLPPLNPFSPGYLGQLDGFFAAHPEYRIVHCHLDCMAGIPLKYAKKHGIPVRIAHSHSSSQDKDLKYPVKLFYKCFITEYATTLFACSKTAGKWMFNDAPFCVINNAIDVQLFRYDTNTDQHIRNSLGIAENAYVIGHVGRFSPPKNHIFLIDIFSCVAKKNVNAYLLLVGEGGLRPKIEDRISALGLSSRVIFTGARSDVYNLLQAMDVFVFPSLYEGLGIVTIEAQAAGLPCLISDKVPIECKKTDLVYQLPLDASAEVWADAALCATQEIRRDTCEEIQRAGFDIQENARWLQTFYTGQELD